MSEMYKRPMALRVMRSVMLAGMHLALAAKAGMSKITTELTNPQEKQQQKAFNRRQRRAELSKKHRRWGGAHRGPSWAAKPAGSKLSRKAREGKL